MKVLRILGWMFAAVGTVMGIALSFTVASALKEMENRVLVPAVVVRNTGESTQVSHYQYRWRDGQLRQGRTDYSSQPPPFAIGEKIQVYVHPDHPEESVPKGFMSQWFGACMIGGFTLIFGGIGIGILWGLRRSAARVAHLKRNGTRIQATITGVGKDHSVIINGDSPYRITAQYREGGTVHVFKSGMLFFDPSPYLDRDKVDVLIMPGKWKPYHMDVDFLPVAADQ